jgi:plastocyanin
MKRVQFLGPVGILVIAATLMVPIFTTANNLQQFSSYLSNTLIDTHIISTAAAATAAKPGNMTTIDIKPGSGVSSSAKPLSPAILHLHKGDTVKWVNNDNTNHSITSLLFDSGVIWPKASTHGNSSFSYTFDQIGTFVYVDRLHPYLGGVIYVDVPTTQRELIATTTSFVNVKIEMPQNAAYKNNYGGFFIPASTQVPVGTKVTWSNKDYVAHTATSADGHTFDTKTVLPGTSLTVTLQHKGVFPYYCKIHPWMLGTILVS